MNFEFILFTILASLGFIALIDRVGKSKFAILQNPHFQSIAQNAQAFFPMLLIVFSIRSFAFEPRVIPSGSLKPTLVVGDFVLVNKFTYGIRLPVIHTKIMSINQPKRGDILVFRGPNAMPKDLIKRVIGVPGDRISYIDKVLYINDHKITQQFARVTTDQEDNLPSWEVIEKQENLFGVKHHIYQNLENGEDNFHDVVVPAGNYFMMGDNRDGSADSRSWGFMPEENIIGKAERVLISYDSVRHPLRWERVGSKII